MRMRKLIELIGLALAATAITVGAAFVSEHFLGGDDTTNLYRHLTSSRFSVPTH